MSEFLPEDLSQKFYQYLKLPPEEAPGMKRKSIVPLDQKDQKKIKLDDGNNDSTVNPLDNSPEVLKPEKVSKCHFTLKFDFNMYKFILLAVAVI